MKQLRLLMAAFAAVFGLCVNAQTWTPSEVGEGTFYLYNVGAQGYLVGANSWGTQASIAKTGGISITLAKLEDGNFTVSCDPTYPNLYLGANGYIDRPVGESSWKFVAVEGQSNVYKMTCLVENSEKTFFANVEGTATTVGDDPNNEFAYWKLVSKENRIADLATATPENPKDATFLIINPNFSRVANTSVWTINEEVPANNRNFSGGANENNCAEVYMYAFTMGQELTVPNGIYKFSGQGAVTYHDNRVVKDYDGGAKPELYLGDAVLGFEEMTTEDKLSNMGQLSNAFTAGNYNLGWSEPVTVENGLVKIGARCERADIWAIWDNFQLQYLGEVQEPEPQGDIVDLIDKFTYTWNGSETLTHNDDKSITFNGAQWGGMAAWIGGEDWSEYEKLVFEFSEPTPVVAQGWIKNGEGEQPAAYTWSEWTPGVTKLECPFEGKDVSQIMQVALQLAEPGTVNISKIYLVKKSGETPAPEFKLTFTPETGTEVAVDDEIGFEFDSDNFQLWVTTDGSDPTTSLTAMNLFPNETVKVKGEGEFVVKAVLEDNKTNLKSEVFTAIYTIKAVIPFELTFTPETGTTVAVDDEITIDFDGDNFQLWVTTDGSDPATSLTAMNLFPNEGIKVTGEGKFVVKAVLENNKTNVKSEVFTATYPIKAAQPVVKDLVLTDDDAEAPAPGEYETITYDRMFFKGYNTIVLPFDYTIAELGADVVMKYEGTQFVPETEEYHVQFTRMKEDQVLQANIPYVVYVPVDKKLAGFEKNKTVVEPTDLTVLGGAFDLIGSYKAYAKGASPVLNGDYIFRIDLQKAKGGNEHKAYRAYLKNNTGAEGVNLSIMVDGELTGIYNIQNAENADGIIYNLNGQRVNNAQKGIFIINGKKVVRK